MLGLESHDPPPHHLMLSGGGENDEKNREEEEDASCLVSEKEENLLECYMHSENDDEEENEDGEDEYTGFIGDPLISCEKDATLTFDENRNNISTLSSSSMDTATLPPAENYLKNNKFQIDNNELHMNTSELDGLDTLGNKSVESLLYHSADSAQYLSAGDDDENQTEEDIVKKSGDIFNLGVQITVSNDVVTQNDFLDNASTSSENDTKENGVTEHNDNEHSNDAMTNGNHTNDPSVTITTMCETDKVRKISELASEESDAVVMRTFTISNDDYDATVTTMLEISPTPFEREEISHDDNSIVKTFEISSPKYNATITTRVEDVTDVDTETKTYNNTPIEILSQDPSVGEEGEEGENKTQNEDEEIKFQIAPCKQVPSVVESNMGVISIDTNEDYLRSTLDTDMSTIITVSPGSESSLKKSYDELSYNSNMAEVDIDIMAGKVVDETMTTIQTEQNEDSCGSDATDGVKAPSPTDPDTTFEDIAVSDISASDIDPAPAIDALPVLEENHDKEDGPDVLIVTDDESCLLTSSPAITKSYEDVDTTIDDAESHHINEEVEENNFELTKEIPVLQAELFVHEEMKESILETPAVAETQESANEESPQEKEKSLKEIKELSKEVSSDDESNTELEKEKSFDFHSDMDIQSSDASYATPMILSQILTTDSAESSKIAAEVEQYETYSCDVDTSKPSEPENVIEMSSSIEEDGKTDILYDVSPDESSESAEQPSIDEPHLEAEYNSNEPDVEQEKLGEEQALKFLQSDVEVSTQYSVASGSNISYDVLSIDSDMEISHKIVSDYEKETEPEECIEIAEIDILSTPSVHEVEMPKEGEEVTVVNDVNDDDESIQQINHFSETKADVIILKTFEDLSNDESVKNVLKSNAVETDADDESKMTSSSSSSEEECPMSSELSETSEETMRKISDFSENEAESIIHQTFEDLSNEAANVSPDEKAPASAYEVLSNDVADIDVEAPEAQEDTSVEADIIHSKDVIPEASASTFDDLSAEAVNVSVEAPVASTFVNLSADVIPDNQASTYENLSTYEATNVDLETPVSTFVDLSGEAIRAAEPQMSAFEDLSSEANINLTTPPTVSDKTEKTFDILSVDSKIPDKIQTPETDHEDKFAELSIGENTADSALEEEIKAASESTVETQPEVKPFEEFSISNVECPPKETPPTTEITYHILSFDNGPSNPADISTVVSIVDKEIVPSTEDNFEHVITEEKINSIPTLDDEVVSKDSSEEFTSVRDSASDIYNISLCKQEGHNGDSTEKSYDSINDSTPSQYELNPTIDEASKAPEDAFEHLKNETSPHIESNNGAAEKTYQIVSIENTDLATPKVENSDTRVTKQDTFEHLSNDDFIANNNSESTFIDDVSDICHISTDVTTTATHLAKQSSDMDEFIDIDIENKDIIATTEPKQSTEKSYNVDINNTYKHPEVQTLAEIANIYDNKGGDPIIKNISNDDLRMYVIDESIKYQRECSSADVEISEAGGESKDESEDVKNKPSDVKDISEGLPTHSNDINVDMGDVEKNDDNACSDKSNLTTVNGTSFLVDVKFIEDDNVVLTNNLDCKTTNHNDDIHEHIEDLADSSINNNDVSEEADEILVLNVSPHKNVDTLMKSKDNKMSTTSLDEYDVIEHDEVNSVVIPEYDAANRKFSFAQLSYKLKKVFSPTEQRSKPVFTTPVSSKKPNVKVHVEETSSGEKIQVLTFSRNAVRYDSGKSTDDDSGSITGSPKCGVKKRFALFDKDLQDDHFTNPYGDKKHGKDVEPKVQLGMPGNGASSAELRLSDQYLTEGYVHLRLIDYTALVLNKDALITDRYPPVLPDYPSDRRSLIALEIYTTERTFVRGLEIAAKVFKPKIAMSGLLDSNELYYVFSNIEQILLLNIDLLQQIFERISSWSDERCVGDVFLPFSDQFNIYAEYSVNYDRGQEIILHKQKKKDFEAVLKECYANPKCLPGQTIVAYLITVIQRLPRYILLLRDLDKRTPETHPDSKNLESAVEMMQLKASYINDQLKKAQCKQALAALETQITGLKQYYIPERTFVYEGPVCLLAASKTYQGVLFNDIFVFAYKGEKNQSEVELVLELKTVWVQDLEDLDPQTSKRDVIGVYTPDRPYRMYVSSEGEKKLWLQHLKTTITAILENDKQKYASEQRHTRHNYKNGTVYEGSFLCTKKHGVGKMTIPSIMSYEGEWEDDEKNGHGIAKYYTGEVYEGEWLDDKTHGPGTFRYATGDEISCQWTNGVKNGPCTIAYKNGDQFTGHCVDDQIEGDGSLICKTGYKYVGRWWNNMKHGKGELDTPEGLSYFGDFERDRFHGDGELLYADGSYYKGKFEHGVRFGEGMFNDKGGCCTYEGKWVDDKKNGKGKMIFNYGDVYEGTWVMDKREGKGKMSFAHGGSYEGVWRADLMHGKGKFELKDGSHYDGQFEAGQMFGYGTMKYSDGSKYHGDWKFDLPDGKGIWTKPNGWVCDGTWQNGRQHGPCSLKDPANDYQYEGDWLNGIKEGVGTEISQGYSYSGQFQEDMYHGPGLETGPEGSKFDGTWYRGLKHGKGVLTHVNKLIEHQTWKQGCLIDDPLIHIPRERTPIQRWHHT